MKPAVAVLLAVVAGAAGGLGGQVLGGALGSNDASTEIDGGSDEVAARLAAIEKRLDALQPPATLRAARPAADAAEGAVLAKLTGPDAEDDDPVLARILQRIDERVGVSVDAKFTEWREKDPGLDEALAEAEKLPISFAEAAAELELTPEQEDEVLRVNRESEDALISLFVDENTTLEDMRRDWQEKAKTDEGKAEVAGLVMGKVFTKMGDFIQIHLKRQNGIRKAIGAKKAGQLEAMNVKEFDSFGLDSLDFN